MTLALAVSIWGSLLRNFKPLLFIPDQRIILVSLGPDVLERATSKSKDSDIDSEQRASGGRAVPDGILIISITLESSWRYPDAAPF